MFSVTLGLPLVPNPMIALLSCALCGFSISLMWPGVLSTTSAAYPKGGTAMFGVLAVCGDIGCSVGPALTGAVSDFVSRFGAFAASLSVTADQLGAESRHAFCHSLSLDFASLPRLVEAGSAEKRSCLAEQSKFPYPIKETSRSNKLLSLTSLCQRLI